MSLLQSLFLTQEVHTSCDCCNRTQAFYSHDGSLACFETEREQRLTAPRTEDGHLKSAGDAWAAGGEEGQHSHVAKRHTVLECLLRKNVNHHCLKI